MPHRDNPYARKAAANDFTGFVDDALVARASRLTPPTFPRMLWRIPTAP